MAVHPSPGLLLGRLLVALSVAMVLTGMDSATDETKVANESASAVQSDRPVQPVRARSRSVYKTDHVSLIIGGASEDAKAKVGRLRVQD